jgi:hypothetical protein
MPVQLSDAACAPDEATLFLIFWENKKKNYSSKFFSMNLCSDRII